MARRKTKVLQARTSDASRDDDSLLTRSAESLGRVIGSLQRQVQDGTKRMSTMADGARQALPDLPQLGNVFGTRRTAVRKKAAPPRKRVSGARKTGARKTGAARTRKRAAAGAGKTRSARKTKSARKKG